MDCYVVKDGNVLTNYYANIYFTTEMIQGALENERQIEFSWANAPIPLMAGNAIPLGKGRYELKVKTYLYFDAFGKIEPETIEFEIE